MYVTDRQADKYHKNKTKKIITLEMYSNIRVEWAAAHFDLGQNCHLRESCSQVTK